MQPGVSHSMTVPLTVNYFNVRLALAVTKCLAVLLANYDLMIAGPEMTLLIYLYLSFS